MTVKNVEGRGWGMTPRGLSYKAFNLPVNFLMVEILTLKHIYL
jgi:hypothetical protein